MSVPRPHIPRLALLCGIALVAVNLGFYLLSMSYFDAHHTYSSDDAMHVRIVFAMSAACVAVVSFIVALDRRILGHGLAAALGVINFIGGISAALNGLPRVLVATLLIAGVGMPALAWFSYRLSRAAWGLLAATCGVFAVVSLFGAPRLRDVLGVSLWTTMLVPALYVVAAITLYLLGDDYASSGPTSE